MSKSVEKRLATMRSGEASKLSHLWWTCAACGAQNSIQDGECRSDACVGFGRFRRDERIEPKPFELTFDAHEGRCGC